MNPRIVNETAGRNIQLLGLELRIILSAADTEGSFELVELTGEPGTGIPPHVHTGEDEVFQILSGRARFFLDGEPVEAGPGTVITGPRGKSHGFEVLDKLRMYFWVFPGTLETMFDQLSALGQEGTPEAVADICSPFGISFVPPTG